jgi:branched-subunit amino acid transport protein
MNIWLIILLGGVLTFSLRLSFIFLLERVSVPAWFKRGLRFVPAAVLSAIILPQISAPNGPLDLSWRNAQLLSGALAVLVAWRTKSVLITIAIGIVTLLILRWLLRLG